MTLGGRYRIERELGRGGMAKVFLGTDTVLGRTVAVKILAPQYADDDSFVQRFRREAQAAASITHPNIVSVFDTGSDDGIHFIVMEYVEGRTLAEILAGGGRILPDRAIDIAMDVDRALEAAHARGVIHRDIKPGNIMLDPRGDVKVTDFGIARVTTTADTVAQTAAIMGTAAYLSPEQAQGLPNDGRSDIYSLGCVLYEMVTGRPPFLGDSPVAVASKQVLEQPVPPSRLNSDITADLDAVILRALAKNPANRYQSADEMRADLERAKRGLPVLATPAARRGRHPGARPPAGARDARSSRPPNPSAAPTGCRSSSRSILIALLGALLWFLAANVLNNDDQQTGVLVTVPNVVGEKRAQAISELQDNGLEVGTITPVPAADDTQEPGHGPRAGPRGRRRGRPGLEGEPHDRRGARYGADPEPRGCVGGGGPGHAGRSRPRTGGPGRGAERHRPRRGRDADRPRLRAGGRPGFDRDDLRLDRTRAGRGARGAVPELRLGPERALAGGPELRHLQRDRGRSTPRARWATRWPRRTRRRAPRSTRGRP